MIMEVETLVAVSLMMAVFSAVAAVGTSLVLGAGFERLRAGFEIVRKQTGFFSDAIHKLEKKVEIVDEQAGNFSQAISTLEGKVLNVGEQANAFVGTVQSLEKKVEVVDKQTGFFSTAINKLEKQIETVDKHEDIVAEKMERHAESDLISTGKAEALVSHAETLLTQVSALADRIQADKKPALPEQSLHLHMPKNMARSLYGGTEEEIRYH